jgi:hypothetical protein
VKANDGEAVVAVQGRWFDGIVVRHREPGKETTQANRFGPSCGVKRRNRQPQNRRKEPMFKRAIGGIVGVVSVLFVSGVFASDGAGKIATLRISNGSGNSTERVSVQLTGITPPTTCAFKGWFAYEGAVNTAGGSLKTSGLLAAYQAGKNVRIVGTGTCDVFGVEQISYIDLQN